MILDGGRATSIDDPRFRAAIGQEGKTFGK
jgi:hypothetical protein